ncbi:hypothetical protein SJAG_00787 [Schizosaccharomyces japonicus yFS275]|uniref:Uncharacterized protein n=1 Tax=Schizosaccharomyces japonicus (strain yFS275 / FY16936) TaxID=402676 RepID=B6JWL0_SCHJY|nr:hypothetical protein SJAG_00787 [Schizosaccharomyces japonicus yFS275]EEB05761.1 hypothetical protein SJAG_00787 [Schizosaccharomyces japonicus yFS275]
MNFYNFSRSKGGYAPISPEFRSESRNRSRKNVRFSSEVQTYSDDGEDSDSDSPKFVHRDPRRRVDPIKHMLMMKRLHNVSRRSRQFFLLTLFIFLAAFAFFILISSSR